MEKEIWKDVVGYEGLYQVSNFGNVKSLRRNKKMGIGISKYTHVSLSKNKKAKTKDIHRLVAEAFIPNPLNKQTVNHKNGIKTDNRVENLEWVSQSENILHAIKIGTRKRNYKNAKKIMFLINGKYIKTYNNVDEASKDLSMNKVQIYGYIENKAKSKLNYEFMFIK